MTPSAALLDDRRKDQVKGLPGQSGGKVALSSKERTKGIYELLPRLNCGFCGFGTCGQFARAVAEGRVSPFGCKQDPWSGYRITEIVGTKAPAYSRQDHPVLSSRLGTRVPPQDLAEMVLTLSQRVGGVLARIEKLETRAHDAERRIVR